MPAYWPTLLMIGYAALVMCGSILGGSLPGWLRLGHTRLQFAMSFVGGLMLGVGVLHLLPHSVAMVGSVDAACRWTLFGLVATFLLIRVFQVHQHGDQPCAHTDLVLEPTSLGPSIGEGAGLAEPDVHRHAENQHSQECNAGNHRHETSVAHDHGETEKRAGVVPAGGSMGAHVTWLGLFVGLGIHTLIDGIALSASVVAASHQSESYALLGFGTFLAILLHKPIDAFSIASVLRKSGWKREAAAWVNLGFAAFFPLGALAFFLALSFGDVLNTDAMVGRALAFSAGVFICIALADILPEIQFHSHDRVTLTASLLCGFVFSVLIGFLEPDHQHLHPSLPAAGLEAELETPAEPATEEGKQRVE